MPQASGGEDPVLQETSTLQILQEYKQIPVSYSCHIGVVNLVWGNLKHWVVMLLLVLLLRNAILELQ